MQQMVKIPSNTQAACGAWDVGMFIFGDARCWLLLAIIPYEPFVKLDSTIVIDHDHDHGP